MHGRELFLAHANMWTVHRFLVETDCSEVVALVSEKHITCPGLAKLCSLEVAE
jgi:hypothetical protein